MNKKRALKMQKRPPASSPNGKVEEMPSIAWDEMSILDTLELSQKQDEASYINVIAAKVQAGMATENDFEQLEYLRSREYQVGLIDEQAKDMARFVMDVPRSWFKKSIPEKLDFDNPETFKMLQPKRFIQLYHLLMMNDAQAEAASGN